MQITELLQRVHAGDQQALDVVIPLVYGELKKLAAGHLSISVHVVRRELRLAQAWLRKEMAG